LLAHFAELEDINIQVQDKNADLGYEGKRGAFSHDK
jgi:hypothetical protein